MSELLKNYQEDETVDVVIYGAIKRTLKEYGLSYGMFENRTETIRYTKDKRWKLCKL